MPFCLEEDALVVSYLESLKHRNPPALPKLFCQPLLAGKAKGTVAMITFLTNFLKEKRRMTEAEVVAVMREHLENQFPKACPKCGYEYGSLRIYLEKTHETGPAIEHDAEAGNWQPLEPRGAEAWSMCACGATLSLSSRGMALVKYWSLLNWARIEMHLRKQTSRELLNHLRREIRTQVLLETVGGHRENTSADVRPTAARADSDGDVLLKA